MAEFVLLPIGNGEAKRLPVPTAISNAGPAAIDAYVDAPPDDVFDAAEIVPYPDPAPVEPTEDAPAAPSTDEESD